MREGQAGERASAAGSRRWWRRLVAAAGRRRSLRRSNRCHPDCLASCFWAAQAAAQARARARNCAAQYTPWGHRSAPCSPPRCSSSAPRPCALTAACTGPQDKFNQSAETCCGCPPSCEINRVIAEGIQMSGCRAEGLISMNPAGALPPAAPRRAAWGADARLPSSSLTHSFSTHSLFLSFACDPTRSARCCTTPLLIGVLRRSEQGKASKARQASQRLTAAPAAAGARRASAAASASGPPAV